MVTPADIRQIFAFALKGKPATRPLYVNKLDLVRAFGSEVASQLAGEPLIESVLMAAINLAITTRTHELTAKIAHLTGLAQLGLRQAKSDLAQAQAALDLVRAGKWQPTLLATVVAGQLAAALVSPQTALATPADAD